MEQFYLRCPIAARESDGDTRAGSLGWLELRQKGVSPGESKGPACLGTRGHAGTSRHQTVSSRGRTGRIQWRARERESKTVALKVAPEAKQEGREVPSWRLRGDAALTETKACMALTPRSRVLGQAASETP